jgi:hypothetical protein
MTMIKAPENSITIQSRWDGNRTVVGVSHGALSLPRSKAIEMYAAVVASWMTVVAELGEHAFPEVQDGKSFAVQCHERAMRMTAAQRWEARP